MFDYSVTFSAIDNVSRSITRINRRLRNLANSNTHAVSRMRNDFGRLDTSLHRMSTTASTSSRRINTGLQSVNRNLRRVTNSAHGTTAAMSGIGSGRGASVGGRVASRGAFAQGALATGTKSIFAGGLSAFALYQPLKVAGEYETAFKDVRKSVEGTPEQFAKMRKEMLAFNGASFANISKVASEAGKMGLNATNVMGFTSTIIKGATALDFDANSAVNSIGKIMTMTNQMDNPSGSASAIMNRVAHLENSLPGVKAGGVLDIWGRGSSMYSQLGFNNNQMAGMSAFLEQNSVSSELGASSFIIMMNKFKAMDAKYGFFSHIKQKGVGGFADVMSEISKLSGDQQQNMFGSEAMRLIGKMLNSKTLSKLTNATSIAGNSVGAVDKEWAIYRNTYEEKAKDLGKTIRVLLGSIGDPMKKMAIDTMAVILPILKRITQWVTENKSLVGTILKVLAAITALVLIFGSIALAVAAAGFVISGFGIVMGALTVGIGALSAGFTILTTIATGFFTVLQAFVLANPLVALFVVTAGVIIYYWDEITAGIQYAIDKVSMFIDYMGKLTNFDGIVSDVKSFFGFDGQSDIDNGSASNIELTLKAETGTSGRVTGGRAGVNLRTVSNDIALGNAL